MNDEAKDLKIKQLSQRLMLQTSRIEKLQKQNKELAQHLEGYKVFLSRIRCCI